MKILKEHKYLIAFTFLIFASSIFYFSVKETKNRIYFNMWFNQIIQKNDLDKLLRTKDPFWGYKLEEERIYKIDDKRQITLKNITPLFEYDKSTKTLNVYLEIFDWKSGKDIKYQDLPEKISDRICYDIYWIMMQDNRVIIDGDKNYDATLGYVDFIKYYFTFDVNEMAAGEPVGGIIYKRNKKTNSFEFSQSFDNASFK